MFAWDPSDGATFYSLYECADGTPPFVLVGSTTETYLEYTSPFPDAKYYVTASNAGGESAPSNIVELTTLQILGVANDGSLNILWFGTTPGAVLQESTDMQTWTPTIWPIDTRNSTHKFFRLQP